MENASTRNRTQRKEALEGLMPRLGQAVHRLAGPFHTLVVSIIEIVVAIAASVLVARYLGVEGMGHFTLAFTIAGILAIALLFGTHDVAIRMYTTKDSEPTKVLGAALWILFVGDGLCILLAVVICIILALSWFQIFIVMLATLVMLINGLGSVFSQAVVAYDMSRFDVPAIVVARALQLAGTVFALEYGDLVHVMLVYILSAGILAVFRARIVHKKCFAIKPNFDPSVRKAMWSSGWKIGLGTVFGTISARSDVLILEGMASTEVVGIYGAAYRVVNGALTGVAAVASALFPRVAKALQANQRTLEVKIFVILPVIIAGGCFAGAVFVAKPIIDILYGEKFEAAVVVLQVLMIVVALDSINAFVNRYMVAAGREHHLPRAQGVGAGTNIILNAILIPPLGALGAALATVGSCITTLMYYSWLLLISRYRNMRNPDEAIGGRS